MCGLTEQVNNLYSGKLRAGSLTHYRWYLMLSTIWIPFPGPTRASVVADKQASRRHLLSSRLLFSPSFS